MSTLASTVVSALVSSTVMGLLVGLLLVRRTETIKREVEAQFQRFQETLRSRRTWQERSLAEVLGPVAIQLDRTRRAFERWKAHNTYLETKVIREGNLAIRDTLLQRAHLLPAELLPHAGLLIEHYDRWLEEFDRVRGPEAPALDAPFVFVGPAGYPFPREAEQRFREAYQRLMGELFT
jgi:hypothetical protein